MMENLVGQVPDGMLQAQPTWQKYAKPPRIAAAPRCSPADFLPTNASLAGKAHHQSLSAGHPVPD